MDAVEEIKTRLPIEDVVGRYVDLKKSGASLKGLCPFHGEKTPSFYVSPARGSYHCFGCGRGGDIFSFVQEIDHLAFVDALKQLAGEAGVALPERQSQQPSLKNRLYEANDAAARVFAEVLKSEAGGPARAYLQGRGFGLDAALLFDLGAAPTGRDPVAARLIASGFDRQTLLGAGLAIEDEQTGELRDRFRGRLMFPIRDAQGRISGFGGRVLGDGQPKYLNSPQTEIFDKSSVLFGVHRAREAIAAAKRAVLVEGYLDAVRAHAAGFANVVASLGTAVTTQQLMALSRLTGTVVLALDPDPAGQAAAARAGVDALSRLTQNRGRASGSAAALDLRIARLPVDAGDPDEIIHTAPERWLELIDASVPAFDFLYAQTFEALDRTDDTWRQQAIDRLLPVIQSFGGAVGWQAQWLERLAEDTGTSARVLQHAAAPGSAGRRRSPSRRQSGTDTSATTPVVSVDPRTVAEEKLVALILRLVVLPDDAADLLKDWAFGDPELQDLVRKIVEWSGTQNYDYLMFRETLTPELQDRADRLLELNEPPPDENKISLGVAYYLARLRLLRIDRQLSDTSDMLQDVEPDDRPTAVASMTALLTERHETERALDRLSQLTLQSGAANPLR